MSVDSHEAQCKICLRLSPEDIRALEAEALERKNNYTIIGATYGTKYQIKISKQNVSHHMKWLRKKIDQERTELLEEQKEKILDTLKECEKLHIFLWDKIDKLEQAKEGAKVDKILRICNSQNRFINSLLKELKLLSEIRGETDRDTRSIDITLAVKEFQKKVQMEEE